MEKALSWEHGRWLHERRNLKNMILIVRFLIERLKDISQSRGVPYIYKFSISFINFHFYQILNQHFIHMLMFCWKKNDIRQNFLFIFICNYDDLTPITANLTLTTYTLCFSKKAKALPNTCKDVPSDARTCVSYTAISQYDAIKRNCCIYIIMMTAMVLLLATVHS